MLQISTNSETAIPKDITTHPCFSENAHQFFSRLHLPVARQCNIQCNYCNRKYDCSNESRPGVTSKLLSPKEAFQKVVEVAAHEKGLSVVGVAGPGDALANPEETFETFGLIKKHFSDLHFCLSTNGLNLSQYIGEIISHDIRFVTVTLNTLNTETAKEIYSWVKIDGERRSDPAAYKLFLKRQLEGINEAVSKGITVKVNSILMPGINDLELSTLSKRLRLMGVTMHNIMPLMAKPEHGSLFGKQKRAVPSHEQLEDVRKQCGTIKQMAHCRQCRADAEGKLCDSNPNQQKQSEITVNSLDADLGFAKRNQWRNLVSNLTIHKKLNKMTKPNFYNLDSTGVKVAVCSKGSGLVDQEFSKAVEFYIYELTTDSAVLVNVRRKPETDVESSADFYKVLEGCHAVLSSKFGYSCYKELERRNLIPITEYSGMQIDDAIKQTAENFASWSVSYSGKKNKSLNKNVVG